MPIAGRYIAAVVLTLLALALTIALRDFLAPMRLLFLWCAVLLSAMIGGFGPAVVAILLSLVAAAFAVFEPTGSLAVRGTEDILRMALFALFAVGLSAIAALRKTAEQRARRSEQRALFINRAGEALASSLDQQVTLRTLAKLCVPELADWCAVHVAREGAAYERVLIEHVDPDLMRYAERLGHEARPAPEHDPIQQVLESGKSIWLRNVTAEVIAARTTSAEQAEIIRKIGIRDAIVAPMVAAGKPIGTLMLVQAHSDRRFSEDDVPLVEELARRAGVALENARLYEAAEAANRAKDEFLATLSHELRTPLTAIAGWAQMLQLGISDEETAKLAVDTIVRSATAQGELVDELLDLSRVVSGKLHLDLATVNLANITEEIATAARPAAEAKSIALSVESRPPLLVRGDARRVRQILWNIVANALKFTPNGGSVRIVLSEAGGNARVEVTDTGEGIDPSFLPHVWDRFRQADSSSSRVHGGLGLGLAVVRHLAEMHGGSVAAESAGRGKGAKFTVELPLAAA